MIQKENQYDPKITKTFLDVRGALPRDCARQFCATLQFRLLRLQRQLARWIWRQQLRWRQLQLWFARQFEQQRLTRLS